MRSDRSQEGVILDAEEGERFTRRWGNPATIMLDRQNGASSRLVVVTERIRPGAAIPVHKHPHADEIVLILQGEGVAEVGEERRRVVAGCLIFARQGTWMGFENTGSRDAVVMGVFSSPGYERYLRATSVPEGDHVKPLEPEELNRIRSGFTDVIVFRSQTQ